MGELGLELQPRLLRVLERRQVKRLGTNQYIPVDVRVIAATNRQLRTEVNERRFRADLYYRLAVLEVRLPSLHERPDDLDPLVAHLLQGLGASGEAAREFRRPDFVAELARHAWPGNVRELRNYLERCLAMQERVALAGDLAAPPDALPDTTQPLKTARERWARAMERRYVEAVLARNGGNVTAAAREAGVDRMYFYRLLWRYGLR